jgi:hypothetical protein
MRSENRQYYFSDATELPNMAAHTSATFIVI